MSAPDWLTARPIAHRGLHGAGGALENTPSAARAACALGFAIECDVQLSADGEAMVFHDFDLDRLTRASGRLDARPAQELTNMDLARGADRIATFSDYVDLIGGRVPLICEIKSRFDGDMRLADRVARIAAQAPCPIALKSFDPEVVAWLRAKAPELAIMRTPLGVVAMADFDDPEANLGAEARRSLAAFAHWPRTRPDFLSFCVDDLPHAAPCLLRSALGLPILSWTVRSAEQARRARQWGDQIIFEGDPAVWA